MKKIIVAFMALAVATAGAFAQSLSDPDASNIGNDSARQALREVRVDRFEREGSWSVHISSDYGVISGRLFEGGPAAKDPLDDAGSQELEDTRVFGVKTEFFRRGVNSFYIKAARPIAIEGITSLSTKPIKLITGLGFFIFFVSIVVLIYSLVRHFTGQTIPGWTTTVLSVWAIGGLIMISLGVIGEYIGKIYLETKNRPRFIIESYVGDKEDMETSEYVYKR